MGSVIRRIYTAKSIRNISIIFMNLNLFSFKVSLEKYLRNP